MASIRRTMLTSSTMLRKVTAFRRVSISDTMMEMKETKAMHEA
jgi:hypothetical protein